MIKNEITKRSKFGFITTLTFIVSILGIIIPILWEKYNTNIEVELQYLGSLTLIEKSNDLEKLQIIYDNTQISTISKKSFIFINTGNKPILKEDLIKLPTIIFDNSAKILDYSITRKSPNNLEVNFHIDSTSSRLSIDFPLLNPDEAIHFNVLVNAITKFHLDGRIVGLKGIKLTNRQEEVQEPKKGISWTVYVVGFFSFFFIFAMFAAINDSRKQKSLRTELIVENVEFLHSLQKKDAYSYFNDKMKFLSSSNKNKIIDFLKSQPDNLSQDNAQRIKDYFLEIISNENSSGLAGCFTFMVVIGILFIIYQLYF